VEKASPQSCFVAGDESKLNKSLKEVLPTPFRAALRDLRAALLSVGLPSENGFDQPENEREASQEMSVVVAICDGPEVARRCLASLELYAPKSEVILIDDGSTLPETQRLIEEFRSRDSWTVIRHDTPRGHSRACEAGARLATRPYLCLLNSDTVVSPWSWQAAKEAFESDEGIAITGPSTSQAQTPQTIRRAQLCRHYWSDTQIWAFARQYISKLPPRSWVDLPDIAGFAFFVRRTMWQELGGFDVNLPDYGNECEFCKRVAARGWRMAWTQNSYIHHFGNQTYGRLGQSVIQSLTRAAQAYIDDKYSR